MGAISALSTRTDRPPAEVYFGGVMFGYSASHIRIWAPNQATSNNTVTLFYVTNGWGLAGVTNIVETSGRIRVMAWKFDGGILGEVVNQKSVTLAANNEYTVTIGDVDPPVPYDMQLLLVQSEVMSSLLPNHGFRFTGIGSSMTEGHDGTYGGLIYGRKANTVSFWKPKMIHQEFKDAICIREPWSTPSTKQCQFGGLTITFTIYRLFTIDDVTCDIDADLHAFLNLTRSKLQTSLPFGYSSEFNDTLELACQSGLVHTSGDNFMYCSREGVFVSDTPIVCGVPRCHNPDPIQNAHSPSFVNTTLGDNVTYECLPGYNMDDPTTATRTCLKNSSWSGMLPVCSPVVCQPSGPVMFATHTSTGNQFMDNVTYSCDVGFPHQTGNLFRTCMADGAWSGVEPVCEYCDCPCNGTNATIKQLNMTLAELLAALTAELKVDKKKTSIAVRKKISVYEDRPVAKGLGSIGVAMLVFVFAFVIIPDIPRLLNDIRFGFQNLLSCCGKEGPKNK
ncbi:sushi, von Willebrand factor type A, EGF and pentraxin domain-containing protein 1-like [Pecten maximus]|uniref:sushi, von Willebrand factor type A, EGF and pentraxin domain-containing protein 1-like n=1 Tax=Pecten maximus TaxID=6579 RepID=UPI0014587B56|nr:sushi, von Willebrand factor type A, EGF and pentraxin domain-containing protein 1-like [Pecten maximus]